MIGVFRRAGERREHPPVLLQTLGIRRECLVRMQLVMVQMAHQGRPVLDPPVAVFLFNETVMLSGALQYCLTASLDLMADLVRVDRGNGGGQIDSRAPCV